MPAKRHNRSPEDDVLVRSYAVTHPAGLDLGPRGYPGWHQLAYAATGVFEVDTEHGTWLAPPHRALWIPAGTRHAVNMPGRVTVRSLYFRRTSRAATTTPARCRAVAVTALLRELILHICRRGILRRAAAADARLAGVVLDHLETQPELPLQLPMPADPRARRAAAWLLDHQGDPPDGAVAIAGASRRTLERLFARDTGLTLGRWQRRARLLQSVRLLNRGRGVTAVALEVGYSNPSAFIAAFRNEFGTTPGKHAGDLRLDPSAGHERDGPSPAPGTDHGAHADPRN